MIRVRLPVVVFGACLALAAGGCGSSNGGGTSTPPPTAPIAAATVTWSNTLLMPGFLSRSFAARQAGTVKVTVSSIASAPVPIDLGIGIPESSGGGCILSQAVEAVSGTDPIITTNVDSGNFCLKIYNSAPATGPVSFSITLVYP